LPIIVLFEFLPYVEEFFRGLRANAGKLIPAKAPRANSRDLDHVFKQDTANRGVDA
jgi:hypothetical protein